MEQSPMAEQTKHILQAALSAIPASIRRAVDYEILAKDFIADDIWAYIQEGADKPGQDQINRQAFERWQWLPHRLQPIHQGSAESHLLGQLHAYPMLLAPIAYHGLVHPQGELAMAQAAAALQTGLVVSSLASRRLEDIAETFYATAAEMQIEAAPLWFQLYWQADIEQNKQLIERAVKAGYQAIVWTVDAQYKRSEFQLPEGVTAVNLVSDSQEKYTSHVLDKHIVFQSSLAQQETDWATLDWIKQQTSLPVIVKGLLAPIDVLTAQQKGADAVVISNHGSRVLVDAVSPLSVLPDIKKALGNDAMPLIVDSGIRSGNDIAKALALGADAVLLGRPQLYALAVAGSLGVAHLIHLYRAELEMTMAQLGCDSVAALSPDYLWDVLRSR
ncbi:alpha-hydroxy-acid oxidizing enzyme [Methylophaga thalassica]|uniref:Alpha-hydroxy-acid oxidizing enzyme n=2 Tax=Methylophaga thalassica TaxID=40223 RepID=A0ABQ5U007_9GAMM|nr:alpha-hydroxy-acid oxidizing enzyme [Methylophaga thalassica]